MTLAEADTELEVLCWPHFSPSLKESGRCISGWSTTPAIENKPQDDKNHVWFCSPLHPTSLAEHATCSWYAKNLCG